MLLTVWSSARIRSAACGLSVLISCVAFIQSDVIADRSPDVTNRRSRSDQARVGVKPREQTRQSTVAIRRSPYRGWRDAIIIGNGTVEAVIVPSINRVMQFRFVNEGGVFWENDGLAGQPIDPDSEGWKNFGGDKTWIAPQSDWQQVTARKKPPAAFNAMPAEAVIKEGSIELVSQIDQHYGIRARRLVHLDARKPQMTIKTIYEKLVGAPRRVSVWVVTQLEDPVGVFARLPRRTMPATGYILLKNSPPSLKIDGEILTLTRDATENHKIGFDADALVWIGKDHVLRIESPRIAGAEYPDGGSSVEIYTSKDPLAYVELETLSPLKTMRVGDTLIAINTYTLERRTASRAADVLRRE